MKKQGTGGPLTRGEIGTVAGPHDFGRVTAGTAGVASKSLPDNGGRKNYVISGASIEQCLGTRTRY